MATTNGITSQTSQVIADSSDLSTFKRKRESTEPESQIKPIDAPLHPPRNVQQQVTDYVQVLKSYDSFNNILSQPISSRESSAEPNAKRKKSDAPPDTISHRAASGIYSSMDHVIIDVKDACSSFLEKLNLTDSLRAPSNPEAYEASEKTAQIIQFKKKAEEILESEKAREASRRTGQIYNPEHGMNGSLRSKSNTHISVKPGAGRAVLTIWGNAPQAKQLFSSLPTTTKTQDGIEVVRPLRDGGLPNGISTTEIVPLDSSDFANSKKPVETLGDLFASSTSKIPIPKPSRIGTTRSDVVGWYQPSSLENPRTRGGQSYFTQQVTCGQWLDYNGPSRSKPKQRSLSIASAKITDVTESEEEKLEALFKNAYSSFAPTRDDTDAIIPQGTLNRIWWQKVGEKRFERLADVNNDQPVSFEESSWPEMDLQLPEDFKIDDTQELIIDPALEDAPTQSIEEKDVDEVIMEISDLLETLNSYQRNRNLNPPTTNEPASTIQKPDDAEIATYQTLKAQLAFMISMLPPFAVSKLNSDQLSELNISTKMQVLTNTHKGTMEEDEDARRAKVAEMARTRPAASPSTHRTPSTSLYGNQYNTAARPPAQPPQYYTQTPAKQLSHGAQRPPATAPQSYMPRPGPGQSYRQPPSYASTPTYPHQIPRQQNTQYGGSQYYSNTPAAAYNPQPNYGNTPMTAPQNRYPSANSTAYQRPPTAGASGYNFTNGSPTPRQASPQKYNSPQPTTAPLNRPYGGPPPAMSNGRYYGPPVPNGNHVQPGANMQPQGQVGASGFHTVMSPAEQTSMMDRQRAQLAQQQGGQQQQARSAAQNGAANGSGQVNGLTAGQ